MNGFQLAGDLVHFLAIHVLLFRFLKTKSCEGISGKSQILFAMVFISRYLDMTLVYISFYNIFLKVYFITSTLATVYLIYFKYKKINSYNQDTFWAEMLVIPALVMAMLMHYTSSAIEIAWAFSIYLEAVAILPQMFLIRKTWRADGLVLAYLACLGVYRFLYILNWIYRYYATSRVDLISVGGGITETVLYIAFFVAYINKACFPATARPEPIFSIYDAYGETEKYPFERADLLLGRVLVEDPTVGRPDLVKVETPLMSVVPFVATKENEVVPVHDAHVSVPVVDGADTDAAPGESRNKAEASTVVITSTVS